MKRLNLVKKLMEEGFSQKTLVSLSDKQVEMLADRILSEQTTTPVINIKSTNRQAIDAAKRTGKTFSTYEQKEIDEENELPGLKVTGSETLEPKVGSNSNKEAKEHINGSKQTTTKDDEINDDENSDIKPKEVSNSDSERKTDPKTTTTEKPKKFEKSENETDEESENNEDDSEEEIDEKEKPSEGLSKEKKSEVVKKAKKGGDIGKKGKGFEKVVKKAKESGAKDPEAVAASVMWKNINRESKGINEEKDGIKTWLKNLIEEEYCITTKKEIMKMIESTLTETEIPVKEPVTVPKTAPTKEPDKKPLNDPWKKPNPTVDPKPKMKK